VQQLRSPRSCAPPDGDGSRDHRRIGERVVPAPSENVARTLLFSADDGIHDRELWKSDGTAGATTIVADIAA
jgi:ELWxxDGT repeat protein